LSPPEERQARAALAAVAELAEAYLLTRDTAPVAPAIDEVALAARLARYDFAAPRGLTAVAADMFELLGANAVRTDSPRYFGLFNPPALPAAAAGDLIAATVNPQLAVWGHAPAAAEIERKLVDLFCAAIGWPVDQRAGTFTSGGAEANHTACLAALARRYPGWASGGLAAAHSRPVMLVSSEAHLAWIKIARSVGLGADAVRLVTPADGLALTDADVERALAAEPDADVFLIVATAGATAHGAIDDIAGLSAVAVRCGAHLHVDAAWAGAVLLSPQDRRLIAAIEQADSVTIDPHKWLAVPMGAGLYLARDWAPLTAAFAVSTSYMPSASVERHDAYLHSMQWSRRFIGLKLFMALAEQGLPRTAERIHGQIVMGAHLLTRLKAEGWRLRNATPLPIVCFTPASDDDARVRRIEQAVVSSGEAWISSVRVRNRLVLRACITSYETQIDDVERLIAVLARARDDSRDD
jgi:aromatic-L-amino-acid/L-tryptophan decarboxylase